MQNHFHLAARILAVSTLGFGVFNLKAHAQTAPGFMWLVPSGTKDTPLAVGIDNQGHIQTVGTIGSYGSDLYFNTYDSEGDLLRSAKCTNSATVIGAAIDSAGNVYATGGFGKTGQFGTIKLTDTGRGAMFVAKYNSSGSALWAVGSTDGAGVTGWAIAVDPAGNSYVTGEFMGSSVYQVRIGTILLNNYTVGDNDAFIAKIDPNGKVLWATRFGDGGVRRCMAITVDKSGNAYAGANSVIAGGAVQMVYKFSSTGNLAWTRSSTPANAPVIASASATAIAVNDQGEVCVTGAICGTNVFGTTRLWTTPGLSYGADLDLEVTKYDSTGKVLWACKDGWTNIDGAIGIAMDSAGNAFVEGMLDKSTTIAGTTLTNANNSENYYYIAKCNAGGGFAWVLRTPCYPGQNSPSRGPMAVAADGSVYVAIGGGGSDFSSLSKLGQVESPSITVQPTNHIIAPGATATLSLQATPSRAVSYQWYRGLNGDIRSPVVGAFSNFFTTPVVWQTTSFWARVSNPAGYADSSTAMVIVPTAPKISFQQLPPAFARGQPVTLTATVSGTEPLSYQWYQVVNATYVEMAGANSSSYTTAPLANSAVFALVVTNLAGMDTALINVRVIDPPTITQQPQSMNVTNGQVVKLSVMVVASQDQPFYQWFQGESGDTNNPVFGFLNTYTTPPLTGTTRYWVLVSNAAGRVQSQTAVLSLPDIRSTLGPLSLSGNRLNLKINGAPGSSWTIQSSADLRTWSSVGGAITLDATGTTNFQTVLDARGAVFYRAVR